MSGALSRCLAEMAARLAFVSRIGSDLSVLQFENERPLYTHVGFALREASGFWVHHLLNTDEGGLGDLYRQPVVDFFRDDPFDYRVLVFVPSRHLQERIARVLESPLRDALHTPAYSRIAYPFATRYQSSNQWVLEVVGAAQSGAERRDSVQRFVAAHGFRPSVLRTPNILAQTLGAWSTRNTRFDDHPLRDRLRRRLSLVLESSLRRYVARTDSITGKRVVDLDDALREELARAPRT